MLQALGTISPPVVATRDLNIPIESFLNFFIGSGSVVFLIVFMWSAIQWLSSAGDKGRLEQAKNNMTYAAIGIAILATSFALFQILRAVLLSPVGTGTSGVGGPQPGTLGGSCPCNNNVTMVCETTTYTCILR